MTNEFEVQNNPVTQEEIVSVTKPNSFGGLVKKLAIDSFGLVEKASFLPLVTIGTTAIASEMGYRYCDNRSMVIGSLVGAAMFTLMTMEGSVGAYVPELKEQKDTVTVDYNNIKNYSKNKIVSFFK
ncbi:MAG: hypothetical protein WC867_05270 [Candidatus Pacearchaeota archaeon]|jgi:hypothetical protein